IVPITLLLVCGQVLPFALLATGRWTFIIAAVLALLPRVLALRRFHQTLLGVVLHPIAIAALLCIQWAGLIRWMRGNSASWKGRVYAT
ncbi:MAG: glycosyl transferase, partial [Chthoniobacterales bacterium]|nr:glycosyl transferase [Chthoniobacterales bacterium]